MRTAIRVLAWFSTLSAVLLIPKASVLACKDLHQVAQSLPSQAEVRQKAAVKGILRACGASLPEPYLQLLSNPSLDNDLGAQVLVKTQDLWPKFCETGVRAIKGAGAVDTQARRDFIFEDCGFQKLGLASKQEYLETIGHTDYLYQVFGPALFYWMVEQGADREDAKALARAFMGIPVKGFSLPASLNLQMPSSSLQGTPTGKAKIILDRYGLHFQNQTIGKISSAPQLSKSLSLLDESLKKMGRTADSRLVVAADHRASLDTLFPVLQLAASYSDCELALFGGSNDRWNVVLLRAVPKANSPRPNQLLPVRLSSNGLQIIWKTPLPEIPRLNGQFNFSEFRQLISSIKDQINGLAIEISFDSDIKYQELISAMEVFHEVLGQQLPPVYVRKISTSSSKNDSSTTSVMITLK